MPRAHPFRYAAPCRDSSRDPHPGITRDPEASHQLQVALAELGFGFGKTILNFPPPQRFPAPTDADTPIPVSLPFAEESDVLVKATRPPLSDHWHADRKQVDRSNTVVERAIFDHYRRYLKICARSHVSMWPDVARYLAPRKRNREIMNFYQLDSCNYSYLQASGTPRRPQGREAGRTAAFFLRVDSLWEGGPGLVSAWGLNAIATIAWCTLIREKFPSLLDSRGLTVVELTPREVPISPVTHDWALDWDVELLLETGCELPPRSCEDAIAS
jgi:hypothetical protein